MKLLDAGSSGRGWSWRESLLRCPQKFAYKTLLNLDEGSKEPLIKGSLVHTGLAHANVELLCAQNGWTNEYLPWRDAIREQALREDQEIGYGETWQRWVNLAEGAVGDYLASREAPTVIAVEHRVEIWVGADGNLVDPPPDAEKRSAMARDPKLALLGPPYLHTSRIDLLERDKMGRYWVTDYKTCYRIDARKRDGFALSGQILGLTRWGAETYGRDFGGSALQMLRLIEGRDRFPRVLPAYGPWALRAWGQTVVESEERLARLLTKDPMHWPKTFSEQGPCMDRYGPCSFRDVCLLGEKPKIHP